MKNFYFFLIILIVGLCSCKDKNAQFKNKKQITQRIQYDVFIKSPNADYEWWRENIEGEKRDVFVRSIVNKALSGKFKVYDYFNKQLTVSEIKSIFNRIDTLQMQSPKPPYNDTTVIVENKLDLSSIVKIRFLEEWYMDEKTMEFAKKTVGIAPISVKYVEGTNEIKGYQPLFWIYLDDNYPLKDSIK